MKIYDTDPLVPYKGTIINAQRTKSQIDGLLAEWGIRDVAWHWDLPNGEVFVMFQFKETYQKQEISPTVRVDCPIIWKKASKRRAEQVNWDVSMRVLYWYLKSHLESSYLLQSSKTTEMLPYIQDKSGRQLKDLIVSELIALPEGIKEEQR